MKPSVSRAVIAGAVALVLGAVNWSIYSKERIKTEGVRVYLELAPVDPRSLMQGDYMALRFSLTNGLSTKAGGSAPVIVDSNGVATLAGDAAGTEFLRIRYRIRNGQVWLGTNAYFFEEGTAARYEDARYGEFRVDRRTGEAVLVALRDKDFQAL
jgi:uncharacterized membrane-anchored protein